MADNSWRGLDFWERVKWARAKRFESAAAAAAALGMNEGTYRCYERGPDSAKFIRLDYNHARRFAREFKVRWEWLLDGLGEPWLTPRADEEAAPSRSPNHLRAWREYRGLTVAELARKSGLGQQTIAGVESGEAELSSKLADVLAPALSTTSGFLIAFDPNDADPQLFEAVAAVPKDRRDQVLEILRTFRPYSKMR